MAFEPENNVAVLLTSLPIRSVVRGEPALNLVLFVVWTRNRPELAEMKPVLRSLV